ncbi:GAF and ANTAR domain-containing protein [Streptomyces sp. BV286]|uniref:GAF and ANTAR domain-containing protein n=1 Tax=unclassified Streptomyces TaxID=2593676 RepID=UPI001C2EB1FD|nr:GAF and ANTAR domain-containing protein [Streptomyces sp. BV286]MBV1937230.1 GAF and ANTAR domain-containing protein [Streptomyces sp. BV286]
MPVQPLEERLAVAFVELAGTLADDLEVGHVLQTLSECCVDLLDVSSAGVVLAGAPGDGPTSAGSDARARGLERDGVDWDEGPSRDCVRSGRSLEGVLLDHPDARTSWPRFSRRALELGFHSVTAVPLRLRDQVVGALTLFLDRAGTPADGRLGLGHALADFAAIGILQRRALHRQTLLTEQLETALQSRILIEQAKGALAQRRQISVDEAFVLLRGHARSQRRRLSAVAQEVLDGTTDLSSAESAE